MAYVEQSQEMNIKTEEYPNHPPPAYPGTENQGASSSFQPVQPQYFVNPSGIATGVAIINGQPQQVTTIINAAPYGPFPMTVKCTSCQALVLTVTEPVTGSWTWCACFICFMFICWLGCCLIPFCMDSFKDVKHSCPNCKTDLGLYKRGC